MEEFEISPSAMALVAESTDSREDFSKVRAACEEFLRGLECDSVVEGDAAHIEQCAGFQLSDIPDDFRLHMGFESEVLLTQDNLEFSQLSHALDISTNELHIDERSENVQSSWTALLVNQVLSDAGSEAEFQTTDLSPQFDLDSYSPEQPTVVRLNALNFLENADHAAECASSVSSPLPSELALVTGDDESLELANIVLQSRRQRLEPVNEWREESTQTLQNVERSLDGGSENRNRSSTVMQFSKQSSSSMRQSFHSTEHSSMLRSSRTLCSAKRPPKGHGGRRRVSARALHNIRTSNDSTSLASSVSAAAIEPDSDCELIADWHAALKTQLKTLTINRARRMARCHRLVHGA